MVPLNPAGKVTPRLLPDWKKLLRTARGDGASTRLGRKYIYILPTRAGLAYVLLLVCMLIGSINYSLSLGFLLTFLLGGLGIVAMLHTWNNLVNLDVYAGRTAPVFAGQEARFTIGMRSAHARYAIGLHGESTGTVLADAPADSVTEVRLSAPSTRRGWLTPGRLTLYSEFPLGLFRAWSLAELDLRCLVYPRPADTALPLPDAPSPGRSGGVRSASGEDDFAGLREHRTGDSMRQVDWKASARADRLLAKQFDTSAGALLWLDWHATPGGNVEARIAQLSRWVLDAHAAERTFGLRLPGQDIAPASGEQHYHACMQALALFGMPA